MVIRHLIGIQKDQENKVVRLQPGDALFGSKHWKKICRE